VQWSNVGDFTAGKGWNPGSARYVSTLTLLLRPDLDNCYSAINYTAQYNPGSSGGSLAVYGWTTNPLVEYYIMEDYTGSGPGGTFVGTVTSDGSSYNIYKHQQVNQPSISSSSSTFWQYISVRQTKRTNGTVTTANHFNAWKTFGLNMGAFNYQIVSTESYGGGSGSSNVTVA
jgi:endo-1,4-beta-xylanase